MTRPLAFPIIALFALLLVSLISVRGEVLALSIPLLVYLGAALWAAPEKVSLTVERQASSEWVSAGTPVTVHLRVRNSGTRLDEVLLLDPLPPGVELIEGKNTVLASMRPGGEVELAYTFRAPRGQYAITHSKVTTRETLGLFWHELTLDAPMNVTIKPVLLPVKSIPIRPPQTRGFAGPIPARQGGAGVDFLSLREYQPGDPQRNINWRIAARYPQELYTNVHQAERVADVGIIVDTRSRVNVQLGADSLFEHSVQAAAALSGAFLNDGNRVGLLMYGDVISNVFPGYGKVQKERILRALARARVGHNYALENLEYLPTRLFPTRSQIVLISPLVVDDLPALVQLRARGYAMLAVCPDPVDFELGPIRQVERTSYEAYAYRLARAERNLLLQEIRRVGVQVVDWRVDQPLASALQQAMPHQHLYHRPGGRP